MVVPPRSKVAKCLCQRRVAAIKISNREARSAFVEEL